MKTIFGLFHTYPDADAAIHQLMEMEFPLVEMNAVIQAQVAKEYMNTNQAAVHVAATDKLGAQTLYGLAQLLGREQPVPADELGPIYAAGDLANIVISAATSAQTGGFKAALTELGVPEETVEQYQAGIRDGGLLFWIRTDDDRTGVAANVLRQQHVRHLLTYP